MNHDTLLIALWAGGLLFCSDVQRRLRVFGSLSADGVFAGKRGLTGIKAAKGHA